MMGVSDEEVAPEMDILADLQDVFDDLQHHAKDNKIRRLTVMFDI